MKQLSFLFCVSVVAMNTLLAQTRITLWSTVNQSEPHIAVNPTNPKNIVVVAITEPPPGIGAYYTTDGGESWNGNDRITLLSEQPGDPVVTFPSAVTANENRLSAVTDSNTASPIHPNLLNPNFPLLFCDSVPLQQPQARFSVTEQ